MVSDISKYSCCHFEGRFLESKDARVLDAFEGARQHGSAALTNALDRWFAGPPNDVQVTTSRGLPLLSVADGNLETFEHDNALKSYKESNHMFADIFGPARVRWPILLFLSRSNSPGVRIEKVGNSRVSLIYLGYPYSLAEVTAAFSSILFEQGIQLVRPWFIRKLRSLSINANDASFRSFLSLPTHVSAFLDDHRGELLGTHTLVLVQERPPDLDAVADHLGIEAETYGVIWCDASDAFHFSHRGETKYDFARPSELVGKLVSLRLSAVMASPSDFGLDKWKRLPLNAFDPFQTAIFFDENKELMRLNTIEAIGNFKRLPLQSNPSR